MVAQLDAAYVRRRPWKAYPRLVSYALFEGRPLTTRGRWINPLVFAHFAVEKRLPCLRRVEKPIFIVGTGRSGTTILGKVLSMHRDIGFLNEPKALWQAVVPSQDAIGSYDRAAGRLRLGAEDATESVRRHAHRLFGAFLFITASRRILDKYPELVFRMPFVRAVFPDARFLFLVRSGWDTCLSIEQWSRANGREGPAGAVDWWGVDRRKWRLLIDEIAANDPAFAPLVAELRALDSQRDMAAVEWVLTMREGMRQASENADVLTVRYEELAEAPQPTLERICDFCDLQADDTLAAYGSETLRPSTRQPAFSLHASVADSFQETMTALGYT